jgi:hypothetical protein
MRLRFEDQEANVFGKKVAAYSENCKEQINLKFASPCIIIQFQYINQSDATISQVYFLTFMYGSTCFGRPHAHHQEHNCSSSLWFY